MPDALEPYYVRLRKRFFKDATPWARDNIVWGAAVLVFGPVLISLQHGKVDWTLITPTLELYGLALAVYVPIHLCRVPKKLDQERDAREGILQSEIASREETIRLRDQSIQGLTEKHKYTPAEQHDYDTAKKALQLVGQKGLVAMRHIRRQGALTFAFGSSGGPLPPGLSLNETLWAYGHCASEGLLTCNTKYGSGEKTFAIAPKMEKILDELLYDESLTALNWDLPRG
jgi:hypothetical protein